MTGWAEGFLAQWQFIHSMTLAFVDEIPDEHWNFSPHRRFAPFAKQLRHVVCLRGLYNDGIAHGRADFARKHEQYGGDLSRMQLRSALVAKQDKLRELFEAPATADPKRAIDFFSGRQPITLRSTRTL
jgi:hypothetical protein